MKVKVEFDLEIDGELDEGKAEEVFAAMFEPAKGVLLSEDYPGGLVNDWALLITGWKIV